MTLDLHLITLKYIKKLSITEKEVNITKKNDLDISNFSCRYFDRLLSQKVASLKEKLSLYIIDQLFIISWS